MQVSFKINKRFCTRKELEPLLSHLHFLSLVILPGRVFVTYLYKLTSSVKEGYHYVHLNKECKADLQMWLEFLTHWNGINLFYENELTNASNMSLYTDASSTNRSMAVGRKNCQKCQIIVLSWLFSNCI